MDSEDLAGQLAHIKGYLKGQGDQLAEIKEAVMQSVVQLGQMDRTVTQHAMRLDAQEKAHAKEMAELSHDIKNCQQSHKLADETKGARITIIEGKSNRAEGAITAFKVIMGVAGAVLLYAADWVYDRAELNYGTNKDQEHHIADLRKEIARLDRVIGK